MSKRRSTSKPGDVQSILVRALDERVPVEGEKRKTITKREKILQNLVNLAQSGDAAAHHLLFGYLDKVGPEPPYDPFKPVPLDPEIAYALRRAAGLVPASELDLPFTGAE